MISSAEFTLPATITQHTLILPLMPKSNNTGRNRHAQDRAKKDWKDHVVMAMHELELPRRALLPPENPIVRWFVDATFMNPIKRGSHGFDVENLRDAFAKPFADSLTGKRGSTPGLRSEKGAYLRSPRDQAERAYYLSSHARIKCGWMVDDSDEHWSLRTRCVQHRGPAQTIVRLAWFDRPVREEIAWVLLGLERGEITHEELAILLPEHAHTC